LPGKTVTAKEKVRNVGASFELARPAIIVFGAVASPPRGAGDFDIRIYNFLDY
jgi:hypothetical protein